jgi:phosphatidylglycerophosphatase A
VLLAFALGVWASSWVIRRIGVQDPSVVVWDEFVGIWITLTAAPAGWVWVAIGFALFRLFDIWKPWPVRWADDEVEGGLGAMLDDALAGAYALIGLQLLAWLAGADATWSS